MSAKKLIAYTGKLLYFGIEKKDNRVFVLVYYYKKGLLTRNYKRLSLNSFQEKVCQLNKTTRDFLSSTYGVACVDFVFIPGDYYIAVKKLKDKKYDKHFTIVKGESVKLLTLGGGTVQVNYKGKRLEINEKSFMDHFRRKDKQ